MQNAANSVRSNINPKTGMKYLPGQPFRRSGAICTDIDGRVVPDTVFVHLEINYMRLEAGLLDSVDRSLRNVVTALVIAENNPEWNMWLDDVRKELAAKRTYEEKHGLGSTYNPNHPFSVSKQKQRWFDLCNRFPP